MNESGLFLADVARARSIIDRATMADVRIDNGNVVDLLADNITDRRTHELALVARYLGYTVRS
jgi:hypothetical protein